MSDLHWPHRRPLRIRIEASTSGYNIVAYQWHRYRQQWRHGFGTWGRTIGEALAAWRTFGFIRDTIGGLNK